MKLQSWTEWMAEQAGQARSPHGPALHHGGRGRYHGRGAAGGGGGEGAPVAAVVVVAAAAVVVESSALGELSLPWWIQRHFSLAWKRVDKVCYRKESGDRLE